MNKQNHESNVSTPISDKQETAVIDHLINHKKHFLKAQKDGQEAHTKTVEVLNKANANLKKAMEENPTQYLKKAMIELNNTKKLLAKKTIELRTFEGKSLQTIVGLQKELKDKDGEIEILKGAVSQISFIANSFVGSHEKN